VDARGKVDLKISWMKNLPVARITLEIIFPVTCFFGQAFVIFISFLTAILKNLSIAAMLHRSDDQNSNEKPPRVFAAQYIKNA